MSPIPNHIHSEDIKAALKPFGYVKHLHISKVIKQTKYYKTNIYLLGFFFRKGILRMQFLIRTAQ